MIKRVSGGLAVLGILILSAWAAAPALADAGSFTARLEPNRAIFPGKTKARGTAKFRLSADGRTLHYKMDVFDLDAVWQIHVHLGAGATTPEGEHYHLPPDEGHGHTVVFLLNFVAGGIEAKGTVAQGTFTAADLSGPFRGQPLQELVDHMNKGWAYVNVHIFQDYGQGRRYCCPSGVRGIILPGEWPDTVGAGAAAPLRPPDRAHTTPCARVFCGFQADAIQVLPAGSRDAVESRPLPSGPAICDARAVHGRSAERPAPVCGYAAGLLRSAATMTVSGVTTR
jgi:hypothetical protein